MRKTGALALGIALLAGVASEAPEFDRCWSVTLDYETGGITYIAARDEETGRIRVFR